MKITKFGHCCLLIEEKGLRILTDPGDYTDQQRSVNDIDVVLITHEHSDHLHMDSVKDLVKNNPGVRIITNNAVGRLLEEQGIKHELLEHGQNMTIEEVVFEGHGEQHAEIYKTYPRVQNTGYFIAGRLFYPGDALYNPGKPVEILGLPVAGPWLKISEAIDYCLEVMPKVAFPVHDGVLKRPGLAHRLSDMVLSQKGIKFLPLEADLPTEL